MPIRYSIAMLLFIVVGRPHHCFLRGVSTAVVVAVVVGGFGWCGFLLGSFLYGLFVDEPLDDDVGCDVHGGVLPDVIELFDFVFFNSAFGPAHAVGNGFEHGSDDHPFGVGLGHHFDHAGEIVGPVDVPFLVFGVLLEGDTDAECGLAVDEKGVGFVIGVDDGDAGHKIVDGPGRIDEEDLESITPIGSAAFFSGLVRLLGGGGFCFFDEFIDFIGEFFFEGVGEELDSFEDDAS